MPTPITTDLRIDALIDSLETRWPGSTVTYSFAERPGYLRTDPRLEDDAQGFLPFTTTQRDTVRAILAEVQSQIQLNFLPRTESLFGVSRYGDIRFAQNRNNDEFEAYAYLPDASDDPIVGDVFLSRESPFNQVSPLAPGSIGYATLYHEILHALGLKHPRNYGDEPSDENELPLEQDVPANTIMTYTAHPQGLQRATMGPYDRLALGALYGLREVNPGDTTHTIKPQSAKSLRMIVDTDGQDLHDASLINAPLTLDLKPGASSSVGGRDNLQLSFDTLIEDLRAGPQADVITGNAAHNRFWLGRSASLDRVDGDAGVDTIVADMTSGDGLQLIQSGQWSSIERVVFSDAALALDLDSPFTQAGAKTALTLFPRERFAEAFALALSYTDAGATLADLARLAHEAALVDTLSGSPSNEAFVGWVFERVLGRPPGPSERTYFVSELLAGKSRESLLTTAAESQEVAVLVGQMVQAGMGLPFQASLSA